MKTSICSVGVGNLQRESEITISSIVENIVGERNSDEFVIVVCVGLLLGTNLNGHSPGGETAFRLTEF